MKEKSSIIISERAPEPVGPYPHARRVGNLLFISGIGPRERGSKTIPGVTLNDRGEITGHVIEEQAQSVFRNIRYIIEDAGARWENIVDVTVFLTHLKQDFQRFNRVYEQHFGAVRPSRTTVEVTALPTPINIELKVIATFD